MKPFHKVSECHQKLSWIYQKMVCGEKKPQELRSLFQELKEVLRNIPEKELCFQELRNWGEELQENLLQKKKVRREEKRKIKNLFTSLQKLEKAKYELSPSQVYEKLFYIYEKLLKISGKRNHSLELEAAWELFHKIHFAWHFPIVEEFEPGSPFPNFYQGLEEIEKVGKEADLSLIPLPEELKNIFRQKKLPKEEALPKLREELSFLVDLARRQFYQGKELEVKELRLLYAFLGEDALFLEGKELCFLITEKLHSWIC